MRSLIRVGCLLVAMGIMLGMAQTVAASGSLAGGWEILGQHTVKAGETLYCIGRAYGVDPWALAIQNNIKYPNLIHPGTVLSVPNVPDTLPPGPVCTPQFGEPPSPPPPTCGGCTCRWTHLVTWGDTLSWISIYYGTDMWSIAQCNCIYNLDFIRAGETLCIP